MPSASPDRFRQSWKFQELSGNPAQAWLIVRRTIATLLAIGLMVACGWLIYSLFFVPKSYLAFWSASAYKPLSAGPVKFACNDYAAIESLKDNFSAAELVNPAEKKLTKEQLKENLRALADLRMHSKDTCIVFVTAHGRVREKKNKADEFEADLLCEPGDDDSLISVSEVLAELKQAGAGTKLVILDAGRDELATGVSPNDDTFAALLESAVKEAADPSLWVLTANAPLERSHVSAEYARSIFGYMVSQALRGEADRNDDHVVTLNELFSYVQGGVAAWVKLATGPGEAQTPQLFHFDAEKNAAEKIPDLQLVKATKRATEPEPVAKHDEDQEEEVKSGGFSKWVADRGKEAKDRFSLKDDIHIFKEMFGVEDHGHGGEGDAHAAHEGGAAGEHGDAEHKNAAHDAQADAKIDSAAAARKQVKSAWLERAQLEGSSGLTSPGVVAPPWWRDLIDRLLWCDQFSVSGVPAEAKDSWVQVAKELKGINQSLDASAAYRLPAQAKISADQAISFALADRLAGSDPDNVLPKPLLSFVREYDALLFQKSPATFKDELNKILAAQKTDLGLANYYEFQLLGLSKDPDVSSEALRAVSRARRAGEKTATDPLCGEGWSQAAIEAADRLRSEGERQLLDRTSSDWDKQATGLLDAATTEYESAFRNLKTVRGTIQYRNETLLRAPDLVHRAILNGGNHEETTAVQKVFSSVRELNQALANPANKGDEALEQQRKQVETLVSLRKKLEDANVELERIAVPADNAWRMANQLATSLPSADDRGPLRGALVAAEKAQTAKFQVPESEKAEATSSTPNKEKWDRVAEELALQIDLAKLAGCDETALPKSTIVTEGTESERIEKLNDARNKLSDQLDQVQKTIAANADGNGPALPAQLDKLRNSLPQWLLLGPQQRGQISDKNNLVVSLDRATWRSLLAWNSERFHHATDDAPLAIEPFTRKASATFRDLANAISNQPPISPSDPPGLSIESPDDVSLITALEKTITIRVTSNASEEKPIWLVAQYNNQWLDLEVPPGVSRQQKLPETVAEKSPGEKASRYPLRPDKLGFDATGQLPPAPNGSQEYTIKIKRLPNADAGGVTKLIVKAVSGETFVRRKIDVTLPGRESLDVVINAPPGLWIAADRDPNAQADRVPTLRPLPNRIQNYSFDIVNRVKAKKNLDVAIVAPSKIPPKEVLLTGALKPDVAKERLEAYGPLVPLGPSMPVELPASDEPVRIKLPGSDPRNDPKANLLLEKPDPEFPGVPLNNGLMILLTDRDTKEVMIRRMEITPQRPRGYLDAVANFNQATEKLEITVSAKNRDIIPPEGLQISADVEGVIEQLPRSLKGVVKAPDYSTTLYAQLLSNGPPVILARVSVDKYPRAFVFQFPRSTEQRDIPPAANLAEVRITSPAPETAYKAPVNSLDVTAEVDAPKDSFGKDDAKSNVVFGVDENQDRVLQNERFETRYSDRQVDVWAKRLSADGSLALDTKVGDFHLGLLTGVANGRVSVLGGLTIKGAAKAEWSKPVEVILDGSPPVIYAVLPKSGEVEVDDDLVVGVITHNDEIDLSGIQKVEATFASAATGDSKKSKWEEAKPDKLKPNAWTVTLSTKDMALGPQVVLIRATDKVGNESEPLQEKVTIVTKSKPAAPPAASKEPAKTDVANDVTGKVQFGDDPVKASVALESFIGPQVPKVESDAKGKFTFPKVPPGKYTLKVSTAPKAINNQFRHAEMEVTVEPKPKPPTDVTVKLK